MNDNEKVKKLVDDAKKATKQLTTKEAIKKFLDEHKDGILKTAKKLKDEEQTNFKQIVNALYKWSIEVDEAKSGGIAGSKIICGLAATVAFMCSLNTVGFILSAPIYAPLLQFAVKKLAGVKEAEVNEAAIPQFKADAQTQKVLSDLAKQCKDMQKKVMQDRFKIYEYEGQQLANFWLHLGRVADALSKGYMHKYVAEDLDRAGECIMNADTHKTPGPTDPRDIR